MKIKKKNGDEFSDESGIYIWEKRINVREHLYVDKKDINTDRSFRYFAKGETEWKQPDLIRCLSFQDPKKVAEVQSKISLVEPWYVASDHVASMLGLILFLGNWKSQVNALNKMIRG